MKSRILPTLGVLLAVLFLTNVCDDIILDFEQVVSDEIGIQDEPDSTPESELQFEAGTRVSPKSTKTTSPFATENTVGACPSPQDVPAGTTEEFFSVWSLDSVYNTATIPTTFTTTNPWFVVEILTYHWNDGQGMPAPGTISLKAADGTMYGPCQALGQDGQGGVPNAAWVIHPNFILPPGTYTVIDSDPASWSQNEETGGAGMAWGIGIRQDNP